MTNSYLARKSMLSGMNLLNFPLFSHFHMRILCLQSSSLLFFSKTSPLSMPIVFNHGCTSESSGELFKNAGVWVHHRPINMNLWRWELGIGIFFKFLGKVRRQFNRGWGWRWEKNSLFVVFFKKNTKQLLLEMDGYPASKEWNWIHA